MSNKNTYKEIDVVEYYSKLTDLQRPEETILNLLKANLSEMKMLDLGVGGGRTTLHFAKLVKEYVGIDYSEEMIAACKKRFSADHISFKVCDVRSMEMFQDNVFDFILFSFNGIDSISHNDRLKAFREIQRVGKPGGHFCFSTHNLQSIFIPQKAEFIRQLCLHPIRTVKKPVKWFLWRFVYNKYTNMKKLKCSQYAIFNDGGHNSRLQTYFIRPIEQIRQLGECFRDIRIYSVTSGSEIKGEIELNSIDDSWLYYLCVIRNCQE